MHSMYLKVWYVIVKSQSQAGLQSIYNLQLKVDRTLHSNISTYNQFLKAKYHSKALTKLIEMGHQLREELRY